MTRHISQVTLAGGRGMMPPSTTVHSGTQRLYKKFWGGYLLEEFSLLDAVGVLWGPRGGLCQRWGWSLYRGIAAGVRDSHKAFLWPTRQSRWRGQTYASFGVPTCHSCPHPCLQTRRTQSKKSFFGRKKKKVSSLDLRSIWDSFALPLPQFECFLSLGKQMNGETLAWILPQCCSNRPLWIPLPLRAGDVVLWKINVSQNCREPLRLCNFHG